jgi:general nucleoside transport system permease protein
MKIKFEKRLHVSRRRSLGLTLGAVVLAFAISAILIAITGANPFRAFAAMWTGAFGSSYSLSEVVVKAIPLMLAGLGVGIASHAKLWNIGGDGQIVMGAFAASWLPLFYPELPRPAMIVGMALLGFLAGGLWAVIAALPRIYMGINEIITTMMFNFIASFWVKYIVQGPWKDPVLVAFPFTAEFTETSWLPTYFGTRIHLGLVFAIVAAILIALLLYRSKWGFELQVIGGSRKAANYAGISVKRSLVIAMLISGGLAGLAGMAEVTGIFHRLQDGIGAGAGFSAFILVALAGGNPFGILVAGFLLGALLTGGTTAQTAGVPPQIADILQGLILFFALASTFFARYQVRVERSANTVLAEGRE